MTADQVLINAIREVLGLEPLYSVKAVRCEVTWAGSNMALALNSAVDWETDHIMAEDGTRTIPMRDRIRAQAERAMRRRAQP